MLNAMIIDVKDNVAVAIEPITKGETITYLCEGKEVTLTRDDRGDGTVTIYASCDNLTQKFIFTPI